MRRFTDEDLRLHPRVSIHAPWEGCDQYGFAYGSSGDKFQFTHPGKGATQSGLLTDNRDVRFNSRTLGRVRL